MDNKSDEDVEEGELEEEEASQPLDVRIPKKPESESLLSIDLNHTKKLEHGHVLPPPSLLNLHLSRDGFRSNAFTVSDLYPPGEEPPCVNLGKPVPAAVPLDTKLEGDYNFNQVDPAQLGLPTAFRGASRGDRGMRRPFRSRGMNQGYRHMRGKPNPFVYRRAPPVANFQPIPFPPPVIGESIRNRSYSREKSPSLDRSHKRRRSRSRSPRRSRRRRKSGRHSRRHRHSDSYSDRSRSRSHSRKHRKKSRRSPNSRCSEKMEITDLRKRWLTTAMNRPPSPKLKHEDNGYSSSSSSSSSSDSEEERKKLVRRKVAKLMERCHMENRVQERTSDRSLVPPPPQISTSNPRKPAGVHLDHIRRELVGQTAPSEIPLPAPPANMIKKENPIPSIVEEIVASKSPPMKGPPQTPPIQTPKTPEDQKPPKDEQPSPFLLKHVINHSNRESEVSPKKKTKRKPRTPPPPPPELPCLEEKPVKEHILTNDENTVVTPSDGPLGMLLIGLTRCCVKSEEDAQIALFVASSLTRGLADYYSNIGQQTSENGNEQAPNGGDESDNLNKNGDPAFLSLVSKSLPDLKDFQETCKKVRGSEMGHTVLASKTEAVVRIHEEISTIFNAEDANEPPPGKSEAERFFGSESPSSSACLLELPEEAEPRTRIPPKLEAPRSTIDPTAVRSRASAVWEPMFSGNLP